MSFHHTILFPHGLITPSLFVTSSHPRTRTCIVYASEPSLSLSAQPYWQEPLDCHRYLTIGSSLLNPLVLCVITYLIWLNNLRR